MTFEEWLDAWTNASEGEPETEWQKGYDAARDMVRIQIKCSTGEARVNDEIIDFYMQVSHELCHGKEWCIGGVGKALRRFAELVVAAEQSEPVATIFMDQHGRQQIEFITTIPVGETIWLYAK